MKTKNSIAKITNAKTLAGGFRTAWAERLLPLALALALPAAVQAQFDYTTNNGTITITRYTGSDSAVTIPSMTNGLPVTSIGVWAFHSCTSLANVTIPNSVTSIGTEAFFRCTSLTSVTIPNSVTNIGAGPFPYCTSLSAITVEPTNSFYSSVDGVLFNQGQTTLIQYPGGKAGNYTVPNGVTNIEYVAFYYCTNLAGVTLPDGVTSIGDYAFSFCTSLASVSMPNSVTSIGTWAFSYCASLVSLTLPDSMTSIGGWTFRGCTSLTNVTIPDSVTNIENSAFADCTSLTAITVGAPNSFYSSVDGVLFNKGQTTLIQCPGGTVGSYTVPPGVTSIESYGFSGCTSLTSVTLPNSVTSIMHYAFYYCTSLTGVYFQGNAPSVGSSVFYGADKTVVYYLPGTTGWGATFGGRPAVMLSPSVPYTYTTNSGTITITGYTGPGGDVTIPDKIDGLPVTGIGERAFSNCTSLASVTIPNSVTNIGAGAFSYCTSLSAITVEPTNSFYSSVDGVLFNQGQTTLIQYPGGKAGSYTVPNGVTNIGYLAFYYCTNLAGVTLPNSVATIGSQAFEACTSLTSVTIPNSVTNIENSAFADCASLTAITVSAPNSSYSSRDGVLFNKGQTMLIQCPGGTVGSYTVPAGVTSIGSYGFSGCTSLTSITIPNSVTGIGYRAFYFCTNLLGVYFKGNAPTADSSVFDGDINATVYYLLGTTGWGPTLGGRPTVLWNPQVPTSDASFGVRTNRFGFTITGSSNLVIVVEVCVNLAHPIWSPVGTNTLTGGSSYFSDPKWTNYPGRFYRLRSP